MNKNVETSAQCCVCEWRTVLSGTIPVASAIIMERKCSGHKKRPLLLFISDNSCSCKPSTARVFFLVSIFFLFTVQTQKKYLSDFVRCGERERKKIVADHIRVASCLQLIGEGPAICYMISVWPNVANNGPQVGSTRWLWTVRAPRQLQSC